MLSIIVDYLYTCFICVQGEYVRHII